MYSLDRQLFHAFDLRLLRFFAAALALAVGLSESGLSQVPGGFGQPAFSQTGVMAVPNGGRQISNNDWQPAGPDARIAANTNTVSGVATAPTADSAAEGRIPIRNLLQIFHDGGLLMYPIAFCSFITMVFFFERLIFLRQGRVIPRPFVKRLIEQLEQQQIDRDEAIDLCTRNPSPIAQIFAAALKRYGRPAVEVEQVVLDAGERVTNQLRKYMRLFSAISNVSPLLGLLGTVLGMIEAFNSIAGSNAIGRPEVLAGGISQALLTTAAGLLVAIPAYLAYMYFLSRTDRLVIEMDSYAQQVIDAISSEGLQENDTSRTRSRSRRAA